MAAVADVLVDHWGVLSQNATRSGHWHVLYDGCCVRGWRHERCARSPVTATLPRKAETILVVEDEEELRQLIGRLLERLGYTVLVAADGASALELCGRQPSIDLLLTDVMMPGIGGLELTRLLLEQRPTLKAIYMSGFGPEVIAQQGTINPTVPFLAKPFTVAALGSKIRGVLGTSRVQ